MAAAAAAERIRHIYGRVPTEEGLVHVAAVWEESPGRYRFIDIGEGAPKSPTDRFVLDFARARADAIVTTGAILRAEPNVTHEIVSFELRTWRQVHLAKPAPPRSLVLTSGKDLDPEHPMFRVSRAETFVPEDRTSGIEDAIQHLEREHGCRTITLEVGPTVTAGLYGSPKRIDELLLSVFTAPELASRNRGGPFPPRARLDEIFQQRSGPFVSEEKSGVWHFYRLSTKG